MLILRWLLFFALRGKELVSLVMIVVFCIWLSSLPEASRASWRMGMAGTVLFPLQVVLDQLRIRVGLKDEIAQLQKHNAALLAENARLSQASREQLRCGTFETLRPLLPSKVVSARAISRNPTRLGGLWEIDAGLEDSITEGMAAITAHGVVGRILTVHADRAVLQSLVDPECRVAVLSHRSRHPGIVYSPDGSQTLLEFGATSDIRVGDSLVSWGAGGTFPRGLPVGKVVEILKTPTNVLKTARIVPYQNPWSVEDLAILVRAPSIRVGGGLPREAFDSAGVVDSVLATGAP